MPGFAEDIERKVIPRWRDTDSTRRHGELGPVRRYSANPIAADSCLEKKIRDWREHDSLSFALDLAAASLVVGNRSAGREAAEFILKRAPDSRPVARSLALRVLGVAMPESKASLHGIDDLNSGERIHALREYLGAHPRNPLRWVDLSREYAVQGFLPKADRAMQVAIGLAPENRFVLRSAARLFLHEDDPESAWHLLREADVTPYDPWLLAAEIATASVAGRNPRHLRAARRMVTNSSCRLLDRSELASALATIELEGGRGKKSRDLFRQSLEEPTENAVAQAAWASKNVSGLGELLDLHLKISDEAQARAFSQEGQWGKALTEVMRWMGDQSFSARPPLQGSFIASVAMEDYERAIEIAQLGLKANSGDFGLKNNLTFSLASLGKVDEARTAYSGVVPNSLSLDQQAVWNATTGLIHFRMGEPEKGRLHYLRALELARKVTDRRLLALASLFLARESILVGSADAQDLLNAARSTAERAPSPEVDQVSRLVARTRPRH